MKKRYKIAESIIEMSWEEGNSAWARLQNDYEPFCIAPVMEDASLSTSIHILEAGKEMPEGSRLIFEDTPQENDMIILNVYRGKEGCLYFKIVNPRNMQNWIILKLSPDFKEAWIYLGEKDGKKESFWTAALLTAAIQLSYQYAVMPEGAFISHSSCVAKDGKAYLFLGKSGTGKSTHSRVWKEALDDVELMNDDHPILKIDQTGQAKAYGSPWSGKTPCYKNLSAPIGAIVRIVRGSANSLRRLAPLESYASLMPSIFNSPFDRRLTDIRHQWLEKMVTGVPCYELKCLPNADAAIVCYNGILQNDNQTN